uniref:Uncharacterized protein n=1 Tax=Arion vulgaris TaxID=1028688 RepID=A0A0B7B0C0_9EUPU
MRLMWSTLCWSPLLTIDFPGAESDTQLTKDRQAAVRDGSKSKKTPSNKEAKEIR